MPLRLLSLKLRACYAATASLNAKHNIHYTLKRNLHPSHPERSPSSTRHLQPPLASPKKMGPPTRAHPTSRAYDSGPKNCPSRSPSLPWWDRQGRSSPRKEWRGRYCRKGERRRDLRRASSGRGERGGRDLGERSHVSGSVRVEKTLDGPRVATSAQKLLWLVEAACHLVASLLRMYSTIASNSCASICLSSSLATAWTRTLPAPTTRARTGHAQLI